MTSVVAGGALTPDDERQLREQQNRALLADEERAVEKIEGQIDGLTETLAAKRAEVERLRAELEESEH